MRARLEIRPETLQLGFRSGLCGSLNTAQDPSSGGDGRPQGTPLRQRKQQYTVGARLVHAYLRLVHQTNPHKMEPNSNWRTGLRTGFLKGKVTTISPVDSI